MWRGGINSPSRNVTSLVDQVVCTREEHHTIGTDKSGHVGRSTLGLGSFELGQSLAVATRGDPWGGDHEPPGGISTVCVGCVIENRANTTLY